MDTMVVNLMIGGLFMKLAEMLKTEITMPRDGVFAPQYYRFLGFRENLAASPSVTPKCSWVLLVGTHHHRLPRGVSSGPSQ